MFTKPLIYISFSIFWTVRKSRLSQTSDVDNCSRWAQSLDFLRMRNCISHADFGRFWREMNAIEVYNGLRSQSWVMHMVEQACSYMEAERVIKMLGNIIIWCELKWAHLLPYQRIIALPVCNWSMVSYRAPAFFKYISSDIRWNIGHVSIINWVINSEPSRLVIFVAFSGLLWQKYAISNLSHWPVCTEAH